jgi:anti-sigma regulatory factor (Ser/Thr protein kinase)
MSMRAVVQELNLGLADSRGIILELVGWETHSWPGVGRDIQDVINHEISIPDVIVGIFWKRLGTPTSRAVSGSVEEIRNALELKAAGKPIEVLVYFNEASYSPQEDELEQIAGIFKFRRELTERGLLTSSYNGLEDFRTKVIRHLTQVIRRWPVGDDKPAVKTGEHLVSPKPGSDSPQSWFDQVAAKHLSVEIAPSLGGKTYALIAAVARGLEEIGFEITTRDRVSIILTELLTNAAGHAQGTAKVEINVQVEIFKTVRISVESQGRPFDLNRVIDTHVTQLGRGEREHGLLRVRRLSGAMGYHHDAARGFNSVYSEVYEVPRPSSVLYNSPVVAPIRYEHGTPPRFLWIGTDAYTGTALSLLARADFAVQKLFFEPLAAFNHPWLGIEFTGRVFVTVDEAEPVYIEPAIENYFRPMFQQQRVLVVAHRTDGNVTFAASEWAESHGLEFYDSEEALARRLAWISPQPPRPS